ncbi:hypothetical protein [Neotamlana laminarinivorans]|uniref:Uncharacterized protein n=1 Tax=Neotamlana laminarinivorans TaxID=2883124 RepID=A0A9X1L2Z2_9FLAO|nr:hypothetical protein [Tamlana laminarinivorans]MCB4800308.1 hypothetical protein [Tamlana laminarinivorans]
MTANWIKYLEQKLSQFNPTDVENRETEYKSSLTYYFQTSYLTVEFLDSTTINQVELGTYKNGIFSDYKILFHNSAPNFTKVKQRLFEIDENVNYVLTYDKANVEKLNIFLDSLFTNGWTEKIFSYKGFDYLIIVEIDNATHRIELKSNAEQDIPMPMDNLGIKMNIIWNNLKINARNRKKSIIEVKPLKKNVVQQRV